MATFPLEVSGELELRLFEDEDAEPYSALVEVNREELAKWFPWVEVSRHPEGILEYIRLSRERFWRGETLECALWYQGKPAGSIGIKDINKENNRTGEIGYWLDKDSWNQGVMTRACRGLIDHAFSEMTLNRIEIRSAKDNLRSQGIPERLGFRREGVLRQAQNINGIYKDLILFGMIAEDWERVQA